MESDRSYVHFHSNVWRPKEDAPGAVADGVCGGGDDGHGTAETEGLAFARGVLELCGLEGRAYREEPLARRVEACLKAVGVGTVVEAWGLVEKDAVARAAALDSLLVGVTWFYRDSEAFDVVGGLMDGEPGFFRGARVWSAGCSSGQEAVTLGMMLLDRGLWSEEGVAVGTDCRMSAVRDAMTGCYTSGDMEALPSRYHQYFQRQGLVRRVVPELKGRLRWKRGDVLRDEAAGSGFGIVSCRNLSIYLKRDAAHRMWGRLYDSLLTGGVLLTGHAELPAGCLGLTRLAPCVYRKEGR